MDQCFLCQLSNNRILRVFVYQIKKSLVREEKNIEAEFSIQK